jgi:hypothetical protein
MRKILTSFIIMFLILPLLSCNKDKYVMPYEPGVTIEGEENFSEYKAKWNNANLSNYTFTFTKDFRYDPTENYVIDVTVSDGKVINCELKEYISQSKEDVSNEEWEENKNSFLSSHSDLDQFLIDNIFESFESQVKSVHEFYEKKSDCYYVNGTFRFSEKEPYITSFELETLLMIKDLDGNGSNVKFNISNFEKE